MTHNIYTTHNSQDTPLIAGLLVNSTFTLLEFLVGFFIGSLALMSDAGHNLAHTLCLVVSLFANKISRCEANETHTFGFRRTTILAPLFNAVILTLLALYIFSEAIQRFLTPHTTPPGLPMVTVALLGILMNGSIALLLRKQKNDLNIKSVFVSTLIDTIGLVATACGGFLIMATKQPIIDPLISMFIGLLILYASWNIIINAVHILMEGVPEGIDPVKIKQLILTTPLVKNIDHLHLWMLASGHAAMSCHVFLNNCSLQTSTQVVKQIKEKLGKEMDIEHATIEIDLSS